MADAWDVIAGAFGFGGPSGDDHGSSNWAAWGHEEICSMLQTTVDPGDIHDAAYAWREQGRRADDLVTGLTRDLTGIVTGGWRGASAEQALGALGPINQWSASQTEIAAHTTELMDSSGTATAQTKAMIPTPVEHNWRESLTSFAVGGVPGMVIDAVAQDKKQSDAHAAPAALQGVTSGGGGPIPSGGDQMTPVQPTRRGQHTGGQVAAGVAAAATGVPIVAPAAASIARSVRSGGGGVPFGGGGRLGAGHIPAHTAGHSTEFGPRPTAAVEAAEGRMSSNLGHGTPGTVGARAGMNAMPMAPVGAGSGRGRDDSEHQRPSYLIEMDDVFTDGRKVAPAVIGEDPRA